MGEHDMLIIKFLYSIARMIFIDLLPAKWIETDKIQISWREQIIYQWDDDDFGFVLDQHA